MCCYHSRRPEAGDRRPKTGRRSRSHVFSLSFFRDDRGVAMLEGIIVFGMLAGVLLGCMLLGQWGTHRQYAQMGARLRTFDAGTDSVARFQRLSDQTSQTTSTDNWSTHVTDVPTNWLDAMFGTHSNDRITGSRRGTQRGRLPSQGKSMFDFSPASVGYHSDASAATNSWADTAANVQLTFLGIAYWTAYNQSTPEGLTSKPEVPASGLPILDTIYARVGVPVGP